MKLLIIGLIIYIFNIPFGYWRFKEKKLSFRWFLAIHIPIPFIVLLRLYSEIGFAFYTYPLLVGSFILGQYFGALLQRFLLKKGYSTGRNIFRDMELFLKAI